MREETILIVEDNPINLKLETLLLTQEGYKVLTAGNDNEVYTVLENFHPQLILMDLQLPGKNGLDLTRDLKREPKLNDIFIVALTAYAMKGDEEKANAAGCDGYMTKPISVATFSLEIEQYLKKQAAKSKLG